MWRGCCAGVMLLFSAGSLAGNVCPAKIRLPFNSSWLPYIQVTDEEVVGTDIEFIRALLAAVGSELQLIRLPESRALLQIEMGEVDLLFAASYTEERARYAWFSQSYRDEVNVVVVHQRLLDQYPELRQKNAFFELAQRRLLGAFNPSGFYGAEFEAFKQLPAIKKRSAAIFDDQQRLEMVLHQRADYTVADSAAVYAQMQQQASYGALQILPFELHRDQIRFMLSKKTISAACVQALDQAINAHLSTLP